MKKALFSGTAVLLTATIFAQPQPRPDGPPKPPPVAERWKHDSTKLQLYVVMLPNQINGTRTAFFSFYGDMDALMQQNKTAPPAREDVEKIRTKRTAALRAVLDAQQLGRFETFEKEFMPPPPHPPRPPKPEDAGEKV